MAYAIEAVRYKEDGTVRAVRWHSFIYEDGLRKGISTVANLDAVADAAARGHAIHICHNGAPGSSVVIVETASGPMLADAEHGDPAQRLRGLPTF